MPDESDENAERNPNRDTDSGRYTAGYTPDDAVAALRDLDGAGTTSEVADAMGCARRTAYNKLTAAEEEGRVTSRDAGGARLWLLEG